MADNADSEVARYALDGDRATAWYADPLTPAVDTTAATPEVALGEMATDEVYLELDLGDVVPVGLVRWSFAELGYADRYDVQISADGETWQTVTTRENALDDEWQEVYAGQSARYLRFLFANPNDDPVLGGLAEVEIFAP